MNDLKRPEITAQSKMNKNRWSNVVDKPDLDASSLIFFFNFQDHPLKSVHFQASGRTYFPVVSGTISDFAKNYRF